VRDPRLDALHASSDRLHGLVMLSHLGSAAVIMGERLEHALRNETGPSPSL